MATALTFADFIEPLPTIATGDPVLDALIGRIESNQDREASEALAAHTNAGPALVARLEQVAASLHDVDSASQAEAVVYQAVHVDMTNRCGRIQALSLSIAAQITPAGEAVLLRIFEEHPSRDARYFVGLALGPVASPATLARMARAMDDLEPTRVWVRDVGTEAAVRLDPATAFDRLAARFEPELALPSSYFARGLFAAVAACPPIDPRWYPFFARFYAHREAVVVDAFFKNHSAPEAVEAVGTFIAARAAAGEPWVGYLTAPVVWGPAGRALGPAIVAAVTAALDVGWSDYRLVSPLGVLVAMDDPTLLPALRALLPSAKRKAKTALVETITKLARNEPPQAAAPGKTKSKKAKKPLDPERAQLAERLAGARFSERRVAELVELAAPRIAFTVSEAHAQGVGTSRFGGDPDLPRGTEWPVVRLTKKAAAEQLFVELAEVPHAVDGKHVILPLGFVAQLRLEELSPFDPDARLPPAGLLSFFARQDIQEGQHGDLFRVASRVLFHETLDDIVPLSPPPHVPERDRHVPVAITATRELALAPPQFVEGLVDDEGARYGELYDEVVTSSRFGLLGHARAAYFRGLPKKGESLLLQCQSGGGTSFEWGDVSSIFFLLANAALARRDFTKAVCVADEL